MATREPKVSEGARQAKRDSALGGIADEPKPQARESWIAFGERCVLTEAELTHAIIAALNQIPGVWVWRMNTGRRGGVSFGLKGQADITGVVRGQRVELEVKLPKGRVEPHQVAFLERMKLLGAIAGVVRSLDDALALVSQPSPSARSGT
jgi:hypothetical protein